MNRYIAQWNFFGIAGILLYAMIGSRSMSFSALMFLVAPLAAALSARYLSASSLFALAVRFGNGLLALIGVLKLASYLSQGIATGHMAVVFVFAVVLPGLNAVYLHQARPDELRRA